MILVSHFLLFLVRKWKIRKPIFLFMEANCDLTLLSYWHLCYFYVKLTMTLREFSLLTILFCRLSVNLIFRKIYFPIFFCAFWRNSKFFSLCYLQGGENDMRLNEGILYFYIGIQLFWFCIFRVVGTISKKEGEFWGKQKV